MMGDFQAYDYTYDIVDSGLPGTGCQPTIQTSFAPAHFHHCIEPLHPEYWLRSSPCVPSSQCWGLQPTGLLLAPPPIPSPLTFVNLPPQAMTSLVSPPISQEHDDHPPVPLPSIVISPPQEDVSASNHDSQTKKAAKQRGRRPPSRKKRVEKGASDTRDLLLHSMNASKEATGAKPPATFYNKWLQTNRPPVIVDPDRTRMAALDYASRLNAGHPDLDTYVLADEQREMPMTSPTLAIRSGNAAARAQLPGFLAPKEELERSLLMRQGRPLGSGFADPLDVPDMTRPQGREQMRELLIGGKEKKDRKDRDRAEELKDSKSTGGREHDKSAIGQLESSNGNELDSAKNEFSSHVFQEKLESWSDEDLRGVTSDPLSKNSRVASQRKRFADGADD